MENFICFKRLVELSNLENIKDGITDEEAKIICTYHTVYVIFNDRLNKVYIGETEDTFVRLFSFWKEDKRHVTGINAPINKIFESDIENTYFAILEENCNNHEREYFWHDYYRSNYNYIIVSHPGRHGCTNPGNKGYIAIHKDDCQKYIDKRDLEIYEKDGWVKGGKKNHCRTQDQINNISKAHLGQEAWNKGRKLTDKQKVKYKGLYQKPDGTTVIFPKHAAKRYHKDWILLKTYKN